MAHKVGVILSGCGVFDGAEIHEATLTMLALSQRGVEMVLMAPDIPQTKVVNHLTQEEVQEKRNVLVESARIARGAIRAVADVKASELDAIIMPGGYGAALNNSNFATAGKDIQVEKSIDTLLKEVYSQGKPIGAMCIAPPILAKVLHDLGIKGAKLTIGNDPQVAGAIEALGQTHVECAANSCVLDEANRVVTTPAYMLAKDMAELFEGISCAVDGLIKLIEKSKNA